MIARQRRPWRGKDVQAYRIWEAHAARHRLREEVPTGQNPLQPVRVEERVGQELGRMKQSEDLEVQRRRPRKSR